MKTSEIFSLLAIVVFVSAVVGYFLGPFTVPGTGQRLLFLALVAYVPVTLVNSLTQGSPTLVAAPLYAAGFGTLAWGMHSGNGGLAARVGGGLLVLGFVVGVLSSLSN